MIMDGQTALICVGFVVVSAALLLFISMVVTKEKSYEEAIAEQRQQTIMLLGTQNKSKLKDKKQKKVGKKVKEKVQTVSNDVDTAEDSENNTEAAQAEAAEPVITPATATTHTKYHVEFKEPQVTDEPVKEVPKRRSKKDKVRPILLNRDMSEEKIARVDEVPFANRFEQLHPKDEFELMQSQLQKEEPLKQEATTKEKSSKQKQNSDSNETKSSKKAVKHQANEIIALSSPEKEEPAVAEQVAPVTSQTNGVVSGGANNGGKEKKKKKAEQNTIQQLAGDKQGVNLQTLTTLVRKAELTRSEVQILIDMLLNKQHEAPTVIDEWSEGKADPVQKLKKQLAEKEKLLIEEQEALVGAQAKLKEVRVEQSVERSQLQQRARGLEETLNAKQLELQAANSRMHGLNQKLQTLQSQINDEMMKNRKLIEDNNAMQMHMQQFEIRLTQGEELKETMQNDIRSLTEQFENQKSIIVHQQYELTQKDEVIKQLEEARIDIERHMNLQMMQDNEHKTEVQQLKSVCQQHVEEIRRLELSKSQSLNEMKSQQEEYENGISQLQQELQRLQSEKEDMENTRENEAEEEKMSQVKIKNLQNELTSHLLTVERLQSELDQQRDKNNAGIASAKQHEQSLQRKLLQRLFPNVKVNDSLPHDQWVSQMESSAEDYIGLLEKPKTPEPVDNSEVVKLQTQIQKNKQSLDEYDNLLNDLQRRTAQTEMEWRIEMDKKNAEIEIKDNAIKEKEDRINLVEQELEILKEQLEQLRLQLSELETQLLAEKEANQRLTNDNALILSQENNPQQSDPTIQIETLHEEINRMSEQLSEEQKKNKELRTQIDTISNLSSKTINHSNTSNGPSVSVEQLLSSTSSAASSINEVLIKKIKKKKKPKKNNGNQ